VQAPVTTVNRTVSLTLTASDNVGVTAVRFFVDGVLLSTEAEDAAGNVATSAPATVTVRNVLMFAIAPIGNEQVPASDSLATAQANLTVNVATGDIEGTLATNGITPTAAHIHDAYAGTNGPVLVPLDQDAGDPAIFTVPASTTLDSAGVDRLLAGALYINVHSAAAPGGEIRGQILPDNFVLRFTDLAGDSSVPEVDSPASGRAALTLDQVTGTAVVQVQVTGLDNATQAHVHQGYAGATGPVVVALTQDMSDPGHWSAEGESLNAAALAAFANGELYVNVHSPANPGGEIRGQVLPAGIAVVYAELSSAQQVPSLDTRGEGLAALTLDESGASVSIHVNTRSLNDASAAHLHNGFGGVNGPVEIALIQDGGNPAHWFAEQQALSGAQLDAILAGGTYINVHTPANPGGEARGQVVPDDIDFLFGFLGGNQSVPAVATAATGTYAVTANSAAGTVVAHVITSGVDDATAAHLHDGFAGNNGGVAIGLSQDPMDVARWSAVGAAIDAAQLAALRAGRYYVNVHTPANPGGEIRGQVTAESIEVLFTNMTGGQQVPSNASAASAIVASTVDHETGDVTVHLRATGVDTATAAHVHLGFAGENGGVQIGLVQDGGDPGHWSAEGAQLDEAGLDSYRAGQLYVNLHTPANPAGEIRGQIAPAPIEVLFSDMTGDQEVPPVATAASGIAASTVNRDTGALTLHVNAIGVDAATASHIHTASAGQNGPVLLGLQQDAMNLGHWSLDGETLDSDSLGDYKAGQLYVNLHTPVNPGGEIRGQVTPPDAAEFDNIDPQITLTSPGSPVSDTVTLMADASDNQGVVEVRFFVDGGLIDNDTTAPYSVDWMSTSVANGDVTLTAEAEDANGNVGVSADVVVTVQNAMPVTLTQIWTQVFDPSCSGCHGGPTSNNLPSGMDLSSAAASYDALVDIPSLQRSLDRVEPSLPDDSYLIRKLEGGPDISGNRMPQGGPFLDQETVDMIRQWITDGAPNN
jgi:hypothetical protein